MPAFPSLLSIAQQLKNPPPVLGEPPEEGHCALGDKHTSCTGGKRGQERGSQPFGDHHLTGAQFETVTWRPQESPEKRETKSSFCSDAIHIHSDVKIIETNGNGGSLHSRVLVVPHTATQ